MDCKHSHTNKKNVEISFRTQQMHKIKKMIQTPPKELDLEMNIYVSFSSIYICGGYNLILSVKECYKLNLSNTTQGWVPIAPLIKGRFNFKMVSANGLIYAVGGEGPFSEHDDIEVHCKYLHTIKQSKKYLVA